jgi:hypothetical protein
VDALSITFRETTVTTKHPAEGIAVDYDSEERLAGLEIFDAQKRFGGKKRCGGWNWKGLNPTPPRSRCANPPRKTARKSPARQLVASFRFDVGSSMLNVECSVFLRFHLAFSLVFLAFLPPPPGLTMLANPLGLGIELGNDKKAEG